MYDVINEGDRNKQGTHKCPNCGRVITIKHPHIGDPPKCSKCGSYYRPKPRRNKIYYH